MIHWHQEVRNNENEKTKIRHLEQHALYASCGMAGAQARGADVPAAGGGRRRKGNGGDAHCPRGAGQGGDRRTSEPTDRDHRDLQHPASAHRRDGGLHRPKHHLRTGTVPIQHRSGSGQEDRLYLLSQSDGSGVHPHGEPGAGCHLQQSASGGADVVILDRHPDQPSGLCGLSGCCPG